jgi:hypothetical protein
MTICGSTRSQRENDNSRGSIVATESSSSVVAEFKPAIYCSTCTGSQVSTLAIQLACRRKGDSAHFVVR